MEINLTAIEHFRRSARNGSRSGASSGERVANRLAAALNAIGDDAALLDSSALDGACHLLHCMAGPWPTDESKDAVFRVVRQAAGKR